MMKIIVDSQYFPSISYFWLLNQAEEIVIDAHGHYEKQSYRNRAIINGSNGPMNLSVPVRHLHPKMSMSDVVVDFKQKWVNTHWRAIRSAYGKAPFYDFYADYFQSILYADHSHLLSYNQQILTICLRLLEMTPNLSYSDNYTKEAPEPYLDYRSVIHPKKNKGNLSGFQPKSYVQIFGKDFVPNLSILDLLFCEGPNASTVIRQSSAK
jgi:hypothetical protein